MGGRSRSDSAEEITLQVPFLAAPFAKVFVDVCRGKLHSTGESFNLSPNIFDMYAKKQKSCFRFFGLWVIVFTARLTVLRTASMFKKILPSML